MSAEKPKAFGALCHDMAELVVVWLTAGLMSMLAKESPAVSGFCIGVAVVVAALDLTLHGPRLHWPPLKSEENPRG